MQQSEEIDFIVPWVDGNDPAWQQARNEVAPTEEYGTKAFRFRDWGLLPYLFRGFEQFAPWVRKIHFVTWGHVPTWLNTNHPKLNIVKHEDFIPHKWLPTFSSHPIELNFFRIDNLAEQFVYFNDDFFLLKHTQPTDFFKDGLPCGTAVLAPLRIVKDDWFTMPMNNTAIVDAYFKPQHVIGSNLGKWLNFKYGAENISTLLMLPRQYFYGFKEFHIPLSLLKSTYEEVWEREEELLSQTSSHKIRNLADVNAWLFENWQYCTGQFCPRSAKFGKAFFLTTNILARAEEASNYIKNQLGHTACINDGPMDTFEFEKAQAIMHDAFQAILPTKSSFEQ